MRRMRNLLAALFAIASAFAALPAVPASAANCSDAEVIFARGRTEPPGIGRIGDVFVNDLRAATPKSVSVYAVNYDADTNVIQGATDMSRHIQYMVNNCPNTRLVVGGYSLGAAVIDIVLGAPTAMFGYNNPLPPNANDHIAAIILFGNGTQNVFGPVSVVSAIYGGKTLDVCTDTDLICRGTIDSNDPLGSWTAHGQPAYIDSGLVYGAAQFAAERI